MSAAFAFRGADGEIDLEQALGPHLGHYVAIMVSGANGTVMQVLAVGRSETPHGSLLRQGHGRPARASSRADLAVQPGWSWDVCGYYVLLGVRWTATKGEVRRAYVAACARDGGQVQGERLTYVTAQLCDDRVRRAYDRVPLGGAFLWDKGVEAGIKRAAAAEASRRMAQGEQVTADAVMEEMGVRAERPAPEGEEPPGDPGGTAVREPPAERWDRQWGFYVLSGPQGAPRADTGLLEAWQGMVAAALRERGIVTAFAVGIGGRNAPKVLRDINEPCIFVMTEKGASPDKAREAVEMGVSLGIVEENTSGVI